MYRVSALNYRVLEYLSTKYRVPERLVQSTLTNTEYSKGENTLCSSTLNYRMIECISTTKRCWSTKYWDLENLSIKYRVLESLSKKYRACVNELQSGLLHEYKVQSARVLEHKVLVYRVPYQEVQSTKVLEYKVQLLQILSAQMLA